MKENINGSEVEALRDQIDEKTTELVNAIMADAVFEKTRMLCAELRDLKEKLSYYMQRHVERSN